MNLETSIDNKHITIPVSKSKTALLIIYSLFFVGIGLSFVINPSAVSNSGRHYPVFFILILGYVSLVFGGFGVVFFILKLFSNAPGLIIDEKGIYIGGSLKGFIEWNDIKKFTVGKVRRTKIIVVNLKHPKQFVHRQTNPFRRAIINKGISPGIPTNNLKCSCDELYSLLTSRLNNLN